MTLFLVGSISTASIGHEFYISITTIQHDEENDKLTIRVKIFVNDLEESIFQERGVRLGLWKNRPIANAQSYVERYITSKLSITVNDSPVRLKFITQKVESAEIVEDHVIICELEVQDVAKISRIKVRNRVLVDAFDSQANIVNIYANGTRKTINLDKKLPEEQIVY